LPLRKAPAPWRQVSRAKSIGDSTPVLSRTHGSRKPRPVKRADGWSKPMERNTGLASNVVGALTIVGITGLLLSRIVNERGRKEQSDEAL
jgi:hypothetical protein